MLLRFSFKKGVISKKGSTNILEPAPESRLKGGVSEFCTLKACLL